MLASNCNNTVLKLCGLDDAPCPPAHTLTCTHTQTQCLSPLHMLLGLSALVPFDPPPAREILSSVNDFQTGVLTVTIFKASRLASPGLLLAPDPYVEMVLVDCDQKRCADCQCGHMTDAAAADDGHAAAAAGAHPISSSQSPRFPHPPN